MSHGAAFFIDVLVQGIEAPEIGFDIGVRVLGQVHFPDALVVGEEGEDGNAAAEARLERGANKGERATLRSKRQIVHVVVLYEHLGIFVCVDARVQSQIAHCDAADPARRGQVILQQHR